MGHVYSTIFFQQINKTYHFLIAHLKSWVYFKDPPTYLPMTHFLQDLWSAMHSLMLPRDKKRSIKNLVKYLDDNVNAHHIQKFGEQIGYCTKRKPEHKSMIQFFGIFFFMWRRRCDLKARRVRTTRYFFSDDQYFNPS